MKAKYWLLMALVIVGISAGIVSCGKSGGYGPGGNVSFTGAGS